MEDDAGGGGSGWWVLLLLTVPYILLVLGTTVHIASNRAVSQRSLSIQRPTASHTNFVYQLAVGGPVYHHRGGVGGRANSLSDAVYAAVRIVVDCIDARRASEALLWCWMMTI